MPAPNDRNNRRQSNDRFSRAPERNQEVRIEVNLERVKFVEIDPELFNDVAKEAAEKVGLQPNGRNRSENKPTQLRRFYDELCMWEAKASQNAANFNEYLPFIRMLNAKVAYAKGRKLVDDNFGELMHHALQQVNNVDTLKACKLFFEAFMGFYKAVRPTDK